MDSAGAGRSFMLTLGADGKKKLTDVVKAKLAELMQSYADDVLAEYVVVLVSHGKHQAQASADLDAFLGDQSEAFVSWLWDHVAANQHRYTDVQLPGSDAVEEKAAGAADVQAVVQDDAGDAVMKDSEQVVGNGVVEASVLDSKGSPAEELTAKPKNRVVKLKRDLEVNAAQADDANVDGSTREGRHSRGRQGNSKRDRSPEPWARRRRSRVDGNSQRKGDASPPRVKAPTRLLESALRDAVAPSGGSFRRMDSDRRLRSVVADAGEPNGRVRPQRSVSDMNKGGAKMLPAIAVALKAAAAAAEDVNNVRHSRGGRTPSTTSVWDRLGNRQGEVQMSRDGATEEVAGTGDYDVKGDQDMPDYEDTVVEKVRSGTTRRHHNRRRAQKELRRSQREAEAARVDRDYVVATEVANGNGISKGQVPSQTFRAVNAGGVRVEEKQEPEASMSDAVEEGAGKYEFYDDMYENSQEEDNDETIITLHRPEEDEEAEAMWQWGHAAGLDSRNCLNPVNTQGWTAYAELPTSNDHFGEFLSSQTHSQLMSMGSLPARSLVSDTALDRANGGVVDTKDVLDVKRRMRQVELEMTKLRARQAEVSKEVQKAGTSSGAGQPPPIPRSQSEVDSHSVLVSNVHFATTQETISAHFKLCGEIVNVKIVPDAAGKPTGSAYVEFVSKDSVEKALALNDSSLHSRSLKVTKKEPAGVEAPPSARPSAPRSLIMPLRGMSRGSFMRGNPMLWRPAVGSRAFPPMPHLQWKRENPVNGEAAKSVPPVGAAASTVAPRGRAPVPVSMRTGRFPRSLSYVRDAAAPPLHQAHQKRESPEGPVAQGTGG